MLSGHPLSSFHHACRGRGRGYGHGRHRGGGRCCLPFSLRVML